MRPGFITTKHPHNGRNNRCIYYHQLCVQTHNPSPFLTLRDRSHYTNKSRSLFSQSEFPELVHLKTNQITLGILTYLKLFTNLQDGGIHV